MAEFRELNADYAKRLNDPQVRSFAVTQDHWTTSLKDFVAKHKTGRSVVEATFQLAMAYEFAGNRDAAIEQYQAIVNSRSNNVIQRRAKGAIKRLTSEGKTLDYSGPSFSNPSEVIRTSDYRGKYVLIHFWAKWAASSATDMKQLSQMKIFYDGKLDIIGVNLDGNSSAVKTHFAANPQDWEHIYSTGGFEGKSASDLGIIAVPTLILLGPQGRMIEQGITVEEANRIIQSQIRDSIEELPSLTPRNS